MDKLGTKEECKHVSALLKKKYGTHKAAAEKMIVSKYTLSRVLNGESADLRTLVKILKGCGYLDAKKRYWFPEYDLKTFYYLNGIMNASLLGGKK